MIFCDEIKLELNRLKIQLDELKVALNYDKVCEEIVSLEKQAAQQNFWDDAKESQKVLLITSQKKAIKLRYDELLTQYEDTQTLIEMCIEEDDDTLIPEIKREFDLFVKNLESQKLLTLLSDEYDKNNAILTFHAGAGGTEAQDWVEMLYRMYSKWAESHKYKVSVLDYLAGDEAGIKSISILICGVNAYGYLKSESGVHRLVRISPFDSSGRRHTSFASLEVMPEIEDSE
ncbi:MAG: PCRF domain-containing protein, partial [Oscillospiraceae bacterium]